MEGTSEPAPQAAPTSKRARLPYTCASELFNLTEQMGFKTHGMTVKWLLEQLSDNVTDILEDRIQVHELPLLPIRPQGRPDKRMLRTSDGHLLTEEGLEMRILLLKETVPTVTVLTSKLGFRSMGHSIAWLFRVWSFNNSRYVPTIQTLKRPRLEISDVEAMHSNNTRAATMQFINVDTIRSPSSYNNAGGYNPNTSHDQQQYAYNMGNPSTSSPSTSSNAVHIRNTNVHVHFHPQVLPMPYPVYVFPITDQNPNMVYGGQNSDSGLGVPHDTERQNLVTYPGYSSCADRFARSNDAPQPQPKMYNEASANHVVVQGRRRRMAENRESSRFVTLDQGPDMSISHHTRLGELPTMNF